MLAALLLLVAVALRLVAVVLLRLVVVLLRRVTERLKEGVQVGLMLPLVLGGLEVAGAALTLWCGAGQQLCWLRSGAWLTACGGWVGGCSLLLLVVGAVQLQLQRDLLQAHLCSGCSSSRCCWPLTNCCCCTSCCGGVSACAPLPMQGRRQQLQGAA